jgi:acyl carrier protein
VGSAPQAETLLAGLCAELAALDPDVLLDRVTLDAQLASLGLDSMTMLSAIAEIESTHSIRIPYEQLTGLETVAQLIALIQLHVETRDNEGPASACPSCQSTG